MVAPIMLSVIIPTLNANATLPQSLACLQQDRSVAGIGEIIVADGGSEEVPCCDLPETIIISCASGRGVQMATGAAMAKGDWFLFLHADTVLGEGWAQAVSTHMHGSEKAAVFRFVLDDDSKKARRLEVIVHWRCKLLALPYGDQGLLISRQLYNKVGGFKPLPLMEDVDMVRRIGRARLKLLDVPAVTSAARYQRDGYVRRMARNLTCLTMWSLGVPVEKIARIYK
jgi:rSAM/selenodomain-associated transferase 2